MSLAACGDSCPMSFEGLNPKSALATPWDRQWHRWGRVLSPLLANLLVNRLAASVRQAAPGVQFGVSCRFTNKLYADEVVTTECLCLGAMAVLLRSTFLSGQELPLVSEYPYPIIVMDSSCPPPCLPLRQLVQCVAWCKSERLPVRFASTLFMSHVLPGISWGSGISRVTSTRFRGSSWDGLQVLPTFQFFWNWDGLTLFTSAPTALSLWPDARRCPAGDRCPLPVRVFNSMFSVP